MPRDYAHYAEQNPRKKDKGRKSQPRRKKLWPVLLLVMLIIIVTFVRLGHHHKIRSHRITKKITVTQAKTSGNEVHFDFYTILPKEQVDVSQLSSAAKKNVSVRYILQVESVKDLDDAKHLQSELTLLGLDVYIDKTESKDAVWYRINIGPYFSKQAAEGDQKKLAANSIKSILRQEK